MYWSTLSSPTEVSTATDELSECLQARTLLSITRPTTLSNLSQAATPRNVRIIQPTGFESTSQRLHPTLPSIVSSAPISSPRAHWRTERMKCRRELVAPRWNRFRRSPQRRIYAQSKIWPQLWRPQQKNKMRIEFVNCNNVAVPITIARYVIIQLPF